MASSGFQRSSTAEKSTGQDSEKQDFNAMLREAVTFRPFFWGLGLVIWTILDLFVSESLDALDADLARAYALRL